LKNWTENLSTKKYALWALFALAFVESSFFPIPPDVLLIALCVAAHKRAYKFALICTLGSLAGGIMGYTIGYWLWYNSTGEFSTIAHLFFDYVPNFTPERFEKIKFLFEKWNFWIVFSAGFTPIPYKLITITAGVFKINFPLFLIASAVGRAGRFFLVSSLFYFFGARIKKFIDQYLELLTLLFLILGVGGFLIVKVFI